jgi:KUP system potassium uptake protein
MGPPLFVSQERLTCINNIAGGTFALYSLISRYAGISLIPNQQVEDAMVSRYKLESPTNRIKRAHWIKNMMENSKKFKITLFLVTVLGTSMVIGDGVLTPCISGESKLLSGFAHRLW